MKKRFNVDSPSFTPSSLAVNGSSQPAKSLGLSPKAASAAPFRPKSAASASNIPPSAATAKPYNPAAPDWVGQPDVPEFVPQNYNVTPSLKPLAPKSTSEMANLTAPTGRPLVAYYDDISPLLFDASAVQRKIMNGSRFDDYKELDVYHLVDNSAEIRDIHQALKDDEIDPESEHMRYLLHMRDLRIRYDDRMFERFQNRQLEFSHASALAEPFVSDSPALSQTGQPSQINPYAQDTNGFGASTYFQGTSNYSQPLQHHLYAPQGPYRDIQSNQRMPKDFFIDENLRRFMQKRTEATLKTFSNVPLPDVEQFHTLVNLDFSDSKSERLLGYPSWLYKAVSSSDGNYYCLRRLEGFKSTNQTHKDVVSVQQNWKRVRNGNVVSVHLAFTNSRFNGPSLFFVTDYHPCSETLAQKHFGGLSRNSKPHNAPPIPEQLMWSYLVQIANALKAIHEVGLAAKVIDPTKVILTGENHLRLNGCAILDVVNGQDGLGIAQHQTRDLYLFGGLLLALGTNNASTTILRGSQTKALDMFRRNYTPRLCSSLDWLLDHGSVNTEPISSFLPTIAAEAFTNYDAMNHALDHLYSTINHELENGRVVRIMTKINMILDRSEYEQDVAWSRQGTRSVLLLARDYIFHQVDANGRPVENLAHVLGCLNRIDAGIEERVTLTSRDNSTVTIVTWKEIKACLESAWNDLFGRR